MYLKSSRLERLLFFGFRHVASEEAYLLTSCVFLLFRSLHEAFEVFSSNEVKTSSIHTPIYRLQVQQFLKWNSLVIFPLFGF